MTDAISIRTLDAWALDTWTFAQEGATRVPGQPHSGGTVQPQPVGAEGGAGAQAAPPASSPFPLILMVGVMGFLLVSIMMSGRKEKKRVADMLTSLTRGDKVQTSGGMIGVVADIRDDEIVLKIDDSGHTKARFAKTSIVRVIKESRDRVADEPAIAETSAA